MTDNDTQFNNSSDEDITFYVGNCEILKLASSGDIFIKGKLADNDKAVVDGFREFLAKSTEQSDTIRVPFYIPQSSQLPMTVTSQSYPTYSVEFILPNGEKVIIPPPKSADWVLQESVDLSDQFAMLYINLENGHWFLDLKTSDIYHRVSFIFADPDTQPIAKEYEKKLAAEGARCLNYQVWETFLLETH